MLRTGEADVVQAIPPEEAEKMQKENPNVQIIPRGQVTFLYIGWMNIDPVLYKQSKKYNRIRCLAQKSASGAYLRN